MPEHSHVQNVKPFWNKCSLTTVVYQLVQVTIVLPIDQLISQLITPLQIYMRTIFGLILGLNLSQQL